MLLYEILKDQLLVLRKTLTELLDYSFIRASASAAGAPIIFVRKPSRGLRFCVDYRSLNAVSKKDAYLLPLMHRLLALPRGTTQALIITPTRELAQQVDDVLQSVLDRPPEERE